MGGWKTENFITSNARLEELLTQNTQKFFDEHKKIENKELNSHDNSSLRSYDNQQLQFEAKRTKISERSMSDSRNKRLTQRSIPSTHSKRFKPHNDSYQNVRSPSSSSSSHNTNLSQTLIPCQRNSDRYFEQNSLIISPSLLGYRDSSSTHDSTPTSKNKNKGYFRCNKNYNLSCHDKTIKANVRSIMTNN